MKVYDLLIAGCWILFLAIWVVSGLNAKKTIRSDFQKLSFWIRLFIFISAVILLNRSLQSVSLSASYLSVSNPYLLWAGVVICAAGISFAVWARMHLGRNWGMPMSEKQSPELITTGPYRLVRHPIYTGICFALLGTALTEGFAFLFGAVWVVALFIFSAKKEEKVMLDQFEEVYLDYKKHTKMIIPFIF